MHQFANKDNCKPARFYLLPKVHKAGVPGRPVISACGSPTEGLSEIVDYFLQPYIPSIPSYIKDTSDFLSKLRTLGSIPSGAFLVTVDVVALYPSIPHSDGLRALKEFLVKKHLPTSIIDGIHDMADIVLKGNVFEFNSEYFRQTSGTAIGTKMAPAYANVFMSVFEQEILDRAEDIPFIWYRFIDDIFMVWTHGEQKLQEFFTYINSINNNIQFTSDYSLHSVHFLDVLVSVGDSGTLVTDLYTKPTDTHQFLHAKSCHPNHIKRSIPYSQALRVLRICSDPQTARTRCDELTEYLVRRGHGRRMVKAQIQRAITNHTSPPPPRDTATVRPIFFTVEYHPSLPDIKDILARYLPILHLSDKMKKAVPKSPIMSFRQPRNLGKTLCRAKLKNHQEKPVCKPCRPCYKKRCKLCEYLICDNFIISTANRKKFRCFNDNLNCDSTWTIYVIECPCCLKQYVGQTNNLRFRMNGHRSDFNLYKAGKSNKMDNKLLYDHLISHNMDHYNIRLVDQVISNEDSNLQQLLNRKEREWIWKLDSLSPNGLNMDDGFYSQNRKSRKH
jgi:hypothetical protein